MKERICTPGFLALCGINLLSFVAFYILIAVLPLYLSIDLNVDSGTIGVILSLYGIAAMAIRPLSGFLVDNYPRKIVFLICLAFLIMFFGGYIGIQSILALALLRIVHGIAFGLLTTATTTIVIDIIPVSRRGTGLGFFGLTGALAMSIGPMLGLWIYEAYSANTAFIFAFLLAAGSFFFSFMVPSTRAVREDLGVKKIVREDLKMEEAVPLREKIFLKGSAKAMLCVVGGCFCYALITNYISIFAKDQGLGNNAGNYFFVMAIGTLISRLFCGRLIDGNKLNLTIIISKIFVLLGVLLLVLAPWSFSFLASAFFMGLGMGSFMPAYQTFFVNMASAKQRGLASSSFFMAFDIGMSFSILFGGILANSMSFAHVFLLGSVLLVMSLIFFITKTMSR